MEEEEQQRLAKFRQNTKNKVSVSGQVKKKTKRSALLALSGFFATNWWWILILFILMFIAIAVWQSVCYVSPLC